MLSTRRLTGPMFIAGAATAIALAPTGAILATAPADTANQTVVGQPHGAGCGSWDGGRGWFSG